MVDASNKTVRINGQRITQARELRGLTKRALAGLVDVSEGVIGDWESKGILRASNFDRLCTVLGFPSSYFIQDPSIVRMTTPSFRRLRSVGQAEVAQASGYGRMVGEFLRVLDQTVGLPDFTVPLAAASGTFDPREIGRIARETRDALNLGFRPIKNATRAVEDAGVIVCHAGFLARGIDAYATHSNGRPIIVLNAHDPARLRMDVLHELGHIVMHVDDPANLSTPQQVERLATREAQAFRFASEMLMPSTPELREDLKLAMSGMYWTVAIEKVKPKWGVSLSAMVRRAADLGIISEELYRERMKDLSRKRWNRKEPGNFVFPEAPGLLWSKYEELKSIFSDAEDRLASGPGIPAEFIRQITARAPSGPASGAA